MIRILSPGAAFLLISALAISALAQNSPLAPQRALLDKYCVTCHNQKIKTASLQLDTLDLAHVGDRAETWEKVVRKLRAGMMPPAGARRPDRQSLDAFAVPSTVV